MEIITRQNAHASGKRHFYTGRPCKYGHVAQRFVDNGSCVECHKSRRKRYSGAKVDFIEHLFKLGFVRAEFLVHPDDMETVVRMIASFQNDRLGPPANI